MAHFCPLMRFGGSQNGGERWGFVISAVPEGYEVEPPLGLSAYVTRDISQLKVAHNFAKVMLI